MALGWGVWLLCTVTVSAPLFALLFFWRFRAYVCRLSEWFDHGDSLDYEATQLFEHRGFGSCVICC